MTFMRLRTMADGQSAGPAAATAGTPGPDRAGLRKVGLGGTSLGGTSRGGTSLGGRSLGGTSLGGTSLGGTSLGALLRRHWLLAVLLAAGLGLRVLAQVAYRPALLYIDSTKYLYGAYPGDDPPGYLLVLKPF